MTFDGRHCLNLGQTYDSGLPILSNSEVEYSSTPGGAKAGSWYHTFPRA